MPSNVVALHRLQEGVYINLSQITVVHVCDEAGMVSDKRVGFVSLADDRGDCWLNRSELVALLTALGLAVPPWLSDEAEAARCAKFARAAAETAAATEKEPKFGKVGLPGHAIAEL